MGEHRVLLAPDPDLLLDLIPNDLFFKIVDRKLCLVVDDDGTISDTHPMYIAWLAEKLKRPLRPEDNTQYDFLDIDPQALGMLKASVFGNARMHRSLPLIEGAAETISAISGMGIAVVILTARPPTPSMKKATAAHKKENGVPFDLMIFHRRKKEIIQVLKHKLECRVVVVDDDPNVFRSVRRLVNVTALLFAAFYNRRIGGKARVESWDEVLAVVKEMANGRR